MAFTLTVIRLAQPLIKDRPMAMQKRISNDFPVIRVLIMSFFSHWLVRYSFFWNTISSITGPF